jgi:sugar fermentation stimulation protein A
MRFPSPLVPGRLLKRYKRFLADVLLDSGESVTAHCANPGAMLGLAVPGSRVWLAPSPNPKAKLAWRWELEEIDGALVGINTSHPNRIVEEAVRDGAIAALSGYATLSREVRYGANSRIDLLLARGAEKCFVEIKNVHLKRGAHAAFPDCVTVRGAKHLAELAAQVGAGHRAVMLYCIQRRDCAAFKIADDLDPGYARAFDLAVAAGVEILVYDCLLAVDGIWLGRPVPHAHVGIIQSAGPPLR